MTDTSNEWDRWWSTSSFQRRVRESIERHRADPTRTVEAYLEQKSAELVQNLEGRKLIYLDTKHWVNLCQVVVQSPQSLPVYNEILGLLELLRQKRRICCPVSSSIFEELMKQNDPETRRATARIMDYLSGGVCVQNWLVLVQIEFAKYVHRMLRGGDLDPTTVLPWTKAGYWAIEHTVELPELPSEDSGLLKKVYIDLRWGMTLEEYQAMPGWIPTPDTFALAWVSAASQTKISRTKSKPSIGRLMRQRRIQLLAALKDQIVQMLPGLCRGLPGSPGDHIAAVFDPIYEGRDPKALPSVEVVAVLDAAIALESTRKVQPNDMWDYLHAAQALPYCDALFCDNFMAQKMRNKPLEFGKLYGTEIGSRPEEIVLYLNGLI